MRRDSVRDPLSPSNLEKDVENGFNLDVTVSNAGGSLSQEVNGVEDLSGEYDRAYEIRNNRADELALVTYDDAGGDSSLACRMLEENHSRIKYGFISEQEVSEFVGEYLEDKFASM